MPAWVPGSYATRPFARGVTELATSAGELVHQDIGAWCVKGAPKVCTLTYSVYARDLSPHGLYIDDERGFINLGRALLCVRGLEDATHDVHVEVGPEFTVATTLEGPYASYREATDHPVMFARDLEVLSFDLEGASHEIALSGLGEGAVQRRFDRERFARDIERLCRETMAVFGELASERFLFLLSVVAEGYGGLEHASSTHCIVNRHFLPIEGNPRVSVGYRTLLGLLSHEYIHAWWVKRVRPRALAKADLARPTPTKLLWLFEGFTAYYDDLVLVRSRVIEPASYLDVLSHQITRVWQAPGGDVRSVEDASFDAWLFPGGIEQQNNVTVSYYAKGATIALALDLELRLCTDDAITLDDVMRVFWSTKDVLVDDARVREVVREVAPTNLDTDAFFARYVEGTEAPPILDLLREFGVDGKRRARRGLTDRGGAGGGESAPVRLGAVLQKNNTKLASVQTEGPAARAGLLVGDELVAIDKERVTTSRAASLILRYRPGDRARVDFFRDGRLREAELVFDAPRADVCELSIDKAGSVEANERRTAWLG